MRAFVIALLMLLSACSQNEDSAAVSKPSDLAPPAPEVDIVNTASDVVVFSEGAIQNPSQQVAARQNTQCTSGEAICNNLFPFLKDFYSPLSVFEIVGEATVAPGFRAILLRGTGPASHDKSGDWMKAESFGVFIVDHAGSHVLTLDIFPTRRMLDYYVRFGEVGDSNLTIIGSGASYGDQSMKHKYFYDLKGRKVLSVFSSGVDVQS